MKAEELMSRHIVSISKSATVGSAAKLMKASHVSVLPVLSNGKLVGILTKKSVERYGVQNQKVYEIMSRAVFVTKDEKIERIVRCMIDEGLPRLPVVRSSSDRVCIGIITTTEIVKEFKSK